MLIKFNLVLISFFGINNALRELSQQENDKSYENKNLSTVSSSTQLQSYGSINRNVKISLIKKKHSNFKAQFLKPRKILQDNNIEPGNEFKHINKTKNLTKRKGNRKKKSELNDVFDVLLSEADDNNAPMDGAIDISLPIFGPIPKRERPPSTDQQKPIIDVYEGTNEEGINEEHTKSPTRSTTLGENITRSMKINHLFDGDDEKARTVPTALAHGNTKEYIDDDVKADTFDDALGSVVVKTSELKFKSMQLKYNEDRKEPIMIPILPAQDTALLPTVPSRYTKTYYDITSDSKAAIGEGSVKSMWHLDGPQSDTVRPIPTPSPVDNNVNIDRKVENLSDNTHDELPHNKEETGFDTDDVLNKASVKSFQSKSVENEEALGTDHYNEDKTTETPEDYGYQNKQERRTTEDFREFTANTIRIVEHYYENDDISEEDDVSDINTGDTTILIFDRIEKKPLVEDVITYPVTMSNIIIRKYPAKKQNLRRKQPYNFKTFSKKGNRVKLLMEIETPQIPFDEIFAESTSMQYTSSLKRKLDINMVSKHNEYKYTNQTQEAKNITTTPSKHTNNKKKIKNSHKNILNHNHQDVIFEKSHILKAKIPPFRKNKANLKNKNLQTAKKHSNTSIHPTNLTTPNSVENTQKSNMIRRSTKIPNTKVDINTKYHENINTEIITATQKPSIAIATSDNPLHNYTNIENKNFIITATTTQNVSSVIIRPTKDHLTTTLSKLEASMHKLVSWDLPNEALNLKSITSMYVYHNQDQETTTFDNQTILPANNYTGPIESTLDKSTILPWYKQVHGNKSLPYKSYNVLPLEKGVVPLEKDGPSLDLNLQQVTRTAGFFSAYNTTPNFHDTNQHSTSERPTRTSTDHKYLTTVCNHTSQHTNETKNRVNENFQDDNDEAIYKTIINSKNGNYRTSIASAASETTNIINGVTGGKSSTMKLKRLKTNSMTDRVLNALLKLNPILKERESSSNEPDSETDVNKTLSLYKIIVQTALDVLDKSNIINNNTWSKNIAENKTGSRNNDEPIGEEEDNINDLMFSETFLTGIFSPGNLDKTDNDSFLPKKLHLNSNLGENIDIQSDSDEASTFDNEPVFSDSELYEYHSKAKSLTDTLLNIILKNSVNRTFYETHTASVNKWKNITLVYKNIVDKILSIFRNKMNNRSFFIDDYHSNINKVKSEINYTTSTSQTASSEEALNKHITTKTPVPYETVHKLDRTTFEEILPLAIDLTTSFNNITDSNMPLKTSKQTQSHTKLNYFYGNSISSTIQQSFKAFNKKKSGIYELSDTNKEFMIVTKPNIYKITERTSIHEANKHIVTTTTEIADVINKLYIETFETTSGTNEVFRGNVITINMDTDFILSTINENDFVIPVVETSTEDAKSTTKVTNFISVNNKTYPKVISNDTNKITNLVNANYNLIDESNVYQNTDDGNVIEKPSTAATSPSLNMGDNKAEIKNIHIDVTTQTDFATVLTTDTHVQQHNTKVANIETSTICADMKVTSFPYESRTSSSTDISLTSNERQDLPLIDSSPTTTRIYHQYLPWFKTVAHEPIETTTQKPQDTIESILNKKETNVIDNDWIFGNIYKVLPTLNPFTEPATAEKLAITTDNFQNSQNEIKKKHTSSKEIENYLNKLAETVALFQYETPPTTTTEYYKSGVTPHNFNQEKTIIDVNPENLSEMLYYEMSNEEIEGNVLYSAPKTVSNKSSTLSKETLNSVLEELTEMKDLAEKKYSGYSVTEKQTIQPYPIKINPNNLNNLLLNKTETKVEQEIAEKVAVFETPHANELETENVSIADANLEKILQKVLLNHKPRPNVTTEIYKAAKDYTTQKLPIKIQWSEIKNALGDNTSKNPCNNCPKIHCFIVNESSDKSKSNVKVLDKPQLTHPTTYTDEMKNMPLTNFSDDVAFQEKPHTEKPLINLQSEQFDSNKILNKSLTSVFMPTKSFFYKKPAVETYLPDFYPNKTTFVKVKEYSYVNTPTINTCGINNALFKKVVEGTSKVEKYPWLGVLLYPKGKRKLVTTVVLVTVQLVIASAWEINKLPKKDFRRCAKVILGHNCSGPRIDVLNYNYHPDFRVGYFSALAIIQIDTDNWISTLRPICPPPQKITTRQFYAMVMPEDCTSSNIQIYKMEHVPIEFCRQYYRKNRLERSRFWPRHSACGKASWGGACLWRSGALLVAKQDHRWHLLGFGVPGPGCEAPSRYIDYSAHTFWVHMAVGRIGQPAVTRVTANRLIFRRAMNQIQRYGPCDEEEVRNVIFQDSSEVPEPVNSRLGRQTSRVQYNLTISSNIEYHCVIFQASNLNDVRAEAQPKLEIRRKKEHSAMVGEDNLHFNVIIDYYDGILYKVLAYGERSRRNNPKILPTYAVEDKIKIPRILEEKILPKYVKNNTKKYEENRIFLSQPFSDPKARRYIKRKSLEKYKNSYTHNFHNKMAARNCRKTIEQPNRRKAKSRANKRKGSKRTNETDKQRKKNRN